MSLMPRRSLLQTNLLIQLARENAPSITVLANTVGASRPSVSRSLHALGDKGLVKRQGREWSLTEPGRAEASAATARLRDDTEQIVRLAGRKARVLSSMGPLDSLNSEMVSILRPTYGFLSPTFAAAQADPIASLNAGAASAALESATLLPSIDSASIADAAAQKVGYGQAITDDLNHAANLAAGNGVTATSDVLRSDMLRATLDATRLDPGLTSAATLAVRAPLNIDDVVSPLLNVQDQFSSLLSLLPTDQVVFDYAGIADQSHLLTRAVENVIGIQRAETALVVKRASDLAEFAWIPDRLTDVTTALARVFNDQIDQFRASVVDPAAFSLAEHLVLATDPVTNYTGAVRYLVEAEIEQEYRSPALPARSQRELGNERLDPILHRLNADFPRMRRGAWLALTSDNPDRLRHAATSQRDLMTQLLRLLTPGLDFVDDDQPGSKIKARVKAALGGSDSGAEFVKSIANAVYSYYSLMSKYTHTNQRHAESLRAILITGEGLIEYLIVNIDLGQSH